MLRDLLMSWAGILFLVCLAALWLAKYRVGPPMNEDERYRESLQRAIRSRENQRGSIMLEMALCIPVFCFLALGSFDMLRAITQKGSLNAAASAAAQCLDMPNCNAQTIATQNASGAGLDTTQLVVAISGKVVTLNYTFNPLFQIGFPQIVMQVTAVAP